MDFPPVIKNALDKINKAFGVPSPYNYISVQADLISKRIINYVISVTFYSGEFTDREEFLARTIASSTEASKFTKQVNQIIYGTVGNPQTIPGEKIVVLYFEYKIPWPVDKELPWPVDREFTRKGGGINESNQ